MSTMAWFPRGRDVSEGDRKFAAAMQAASEVTVKARSLLDQIRPYAEADDPFAALVAARDRAESYEKDQEKRIFLGPGK